MTRNEVIMRAIAGKLTWIQAADICGITARQMRRMKPPRIRGKFWLKKMWLGA